MQSNDKELVGIAVHFRTEQGMEQSKSRSGAVDGTEQEQSRAGVEHWGQQQSRGHRYLPTVAAPEMHPKYPASKPPVPNLQTHSTKPPILQSAI